MKQFLKRGLAILTAFILCLQFGKIDAQAANVVIALSASTVSVGNNVTATISVSGSDISAYTIYVSYNSSVLQYNSASGSAIVNGGGGTVTASGTSAGSFSISFTAIANGSGSITTSGSDVYDINGNAISISHAGATVTVATASNNGDTNNGNATTEAGETTETTEDDGRSADCDLASLQVSPGTLTPAFSADRTTYSLQVDEDVTSVVVSASAADGNATTSVSGANSIQKGKNTVRVTVTAENGAVKVYTINVQAGEDVGDPVATIDGKEYSFVMNEDGLEAPEAQSNVESVLSAHPDANVFVGVGAGAMIGSNEALLQKYGKGKIPENVGVITTDVTEQQLNSLKAGNEAVRSIVGFEGSNEDTAKACMKMYERILSGEKFEGDDHNVYRTIKPITTDNIDEILKGM